MKHPQKISHPPTREEQAAAEVGITSFAKGARSLAIAVLCLIVGLIPLYEILTANRSPKDGPSTSPSPNATPSSFHLPTASELQAIEKRLESASTLHTRLRPNVQSLLTNLLRCGSHQVLLTNSDWLFYRPDVEHLTAPPFLSPSNLLKRRQNPSIQPDPLVAIRDFNRQLRERDIQLIIVPIPSKAAIESNRLGKPGLGVPENPSLQPFLAALNAEGIHTIDLRSTLRSQESRNLDTPLYLRTDTHWTPTTMRIAAHAIAKLVSPNPSPAENPTTPSQISHRGDLVPMLGLNDETAKRFIASVQIQQVTNGSGLWRPSSTSDTLLLGDSFANIFSLESMGWGESAGLAEHLSHAINQPIDAITRNSDGAFATREMLAAQLKRGNDRLTGKRRVIWAFAERELSFGNWKIIPLESSEATPSDFLELAPNESVQITATVVAVSHVPRPNSVAYPDHLCSVHLTDISSPTSSLKANSAIALTWSMRNRTWTQAARWRPGDRVSLKLRPWSELEPSLGKINQSSLDDPALLAVEPVWAE